METKNIKYNKSVLDFVLEIKTKQNSLFSHVRAFIIAFLAPLREDEEEVVVAG